MDVLPVHAVVRLSQVSTHQLLLLQVVAAVQAAEAVHGPVDMLLCCAGAAELGACPDSWTRQSWHTRH